MVFLAAAFSAECVDISGYFQKHGKFHRHPAPHLYLINVIIKHELDGKGFLAFRL